MTEDPKKTKNGFFDWTQEFIRIISTHDEEYRQLLTAHEVVQQEMMDAKKRIKKKNDQEVLEFFKELISKMNKVYENPETSDFTRKEMALLLKILNIQFIITCTMEHKIGWNNSMTRS